VAHDTVESLHSSVPPEVRAEPAQSAPYLLSEAEAFAARARNGWLQLVLASLLRPLRGGSDAAVMLTIGEKCERLRVTPLLRQI
jgi:hypothetical protein